MTRAASIDTVAPVLDSNEDDVLGTVVAVGREDVAVAARQRRKATAAESG